VAYAHWMLSDALKLKQGGKNGKSEGTVAGMRNGGNIEHPTPNIEHRIPDQQLW